MMKKISLYAALTLLLGLGFNLPSMAQTNPIPPPTSPYTGGMVRGFAFVAPTDFTITGLRVPAIAGTGVQSIAVLRAHDASWPIYSTTSTNYDQLFYTNSGTNGQIISVNILVDAGDSIVILGQAGTTDAYGPSSETVITIDGQTTTIHRAGIQRDIATTAPDKYWTETSSSIGNVEMYYVTAPPADCDTLDLPGTIALADVDTLCKIGDVNLDLDTTISRVSHLTFQWQTSDDGQSNWTDLGSPMTHADTTVTDVDETTWYRCQLLCHNTVDTISSSVQVWVNDPQITRVRDGSRCGDGRVLLAAYGNATTTNFAWYASEDGQTPVHVGSTFRTPSLSATDTFWVEPLAGTPTANAAWLGTEQNVASTTTEYSPFLTYYGSNNVQMMFKASELNAEGLTAGTINQLVFDVATATTVPLEDFEIKIGTTTQTDLNSRVSGLTVVYNSSAQPIAAGMDTFDLSTPFVWDGTSNLVVEVCHNNHNTGNGSGHGQAHYTTTSYTSVYYNYYDNPSFSMCSQPGQGYNGNISNRQNIKFLINSPCAGPRVPVVANISTGNDPSVDLGDNSIVCADDVLDAGNPGASYYWNTQDTTQTITQSGPGTYWVAVTNGHGCTAMDTTVIDSIKPLPEAGSIDITNGSVAGDFLFSSEGDQNATDYDWNFGDQSNNTGSGANVSHAYAESGTYTVTLVVSNDCGSDTITKEINVEEGTSISEINLDNDQLSLFPNPATNKVTLKNESDLNMKSVIVYNLLGQKVFEGTTNNAVLYQLNTSGYASGMYNVRIVFDNGNWINRKFEIRK